MSGVNGKITIDIGPDKAEFEHGPELARVLRRVTKNLRAYVADQEINGTAGTLRAALEGSGVLEAEALLKECRR